MAHGYDSGRLNLPFVGICTFGKSPYVSDWDAIDADIAVMGAPFDSGTQWRAGARFDAGAYHMVYAKHPQNRATQILNMGCKLIYSARIIVAGHMSLRFDSRPIHHYISSSEPDANLHYLGRLR